MFVYCGGGVFLIYFLYNLNANLNNHTNRQAIELASISKEVRESLGEELTFGIPTLIKKTGSSTSQYRIPVQGELDRGDVEVTARFHSSENRDELESAHAVTSVGNIIVLKKRAVF